MWKNRLILIFGIIGSGVLVSFYGGRVSYALFVFFLLIPVISFLYTLYVFLRFTFLQKVYSPTIVKNEPAEFYFQLCNQDIIAYTGIRVCYFKDKSTMAPFDESTEFCLLPGEKAEVYTKLTCKYRGEYFVGIKEFVVRDYLQIMEIHYPISTELMVTVYPRKNMIDAGDVFLEEEDEKRIRRLLQGEEMPDGDIHKYVEGESLKRVHWKATAKRNEIMTRQYRVSERRPVFIHFDLHKMKEDELTRIQLEDAAIEEVLAIAIFCLKEQLPCTIFYDKGGLKEITVNNEEEMAAFYKWCAKIPFTANFGVPELLKNSNERNSDFGQHIVITHKLSENTFSAITGFTNEERIVSVGLVGFASDKDEIPRKKALRELGVTLFEITPKEVTENETV